MIFWKVITSHGLIVAHKESKKSKNKEHVCVCVCVFLFRPRALGVCPYYEVAEFQPWTVTPLEPRLCQ